MIEWMSNGGDCRTAPATPGLLNMQQKKVQIGEFTPHNFTLEKK